MPHEKPNRRDETELERVDRNMIELLNELRVALPGVQVLFAFHLVLSFNQGMGYDERFRRTWSFYLAFSESGFAETRIRDVQMLFAKPRWSGSPRESSVPIPIVTADEAPIGILRERS